MLFLKTLASLASFARDGPLPETAHGPPAPNQTRLGRLAASASVCSTGHIRDLAYTGAKQLTTLPVRPTNPKIFKLARVLVDRGANALRNHQIAGRPPSGTRCGCWTSIRATTTSRRRPLSPSSAPTASFRQAPRHWRRAHASRRGTRQLTMLLSEIAALLATAYQRHARAPADPDGRRRRCRQQKALITRGNRALMN